MSLNLNLITLVPINVIDGKPEPKENYSFEELPTHSPSIIFDLGGVSRFSFLENEYSVLSFSVMYLTQN